MDHISSYTDQFPDVCTPGILKDEAKAYTPAQSCPQQIINIILWFYNTIESIWAGLSTTAAS